MTTTTTITILGLCSALGFTASAVIPQSPTDLIPWKDIAGGGASVLLLVALVLFLRFLREDRSARDGERQKDREHVEKVVGDCTTMTARLGGDFRTTVTELVGAMREEQKASRQELHDLVRDAKRAP